MSSNPNVPLAVALLSGASVGGAALLVNLPTGLALISGAVVTALALLFQGSQKAAENQEDISGHKEKKEKKKRKRSSSLLHLLLGLLNSIFYLRNLLQNQNQRNQKKRLVRKRRVNQHQNLLKHPSNPNTKKSLLLLNPPLNPLHLNQQNQSLLHHRSLQKLRMKRQKSSQKLKLQSKKNGRKKKQK